tara:strand:- start:1333 stop:3729 length:2397 start_codon:yes stop_codon:yes gene_type:complete
MVMGSNRVEITITAKDQASRELNKVSTTAGKIGGKLKGLAKGPLPAVAAAAAVAGLTASIKLAAGFEKGMAEVRTLLPNITNEAFGKMNKDVLKFSKTMGVDLGDATKGLYNAISAGVPRENVMEFMTQAAKTASGGVTDLETSVGALAGVMNVYGDSVGGAQEVSDILFTTVKGGMTTMPELASAIGRVLPTAAAMGVSFKDISADLAVMTAQTGDTNASVTRLNGLLVEAGRTGTKLSDAISEKLGSSFRELIAEGKSTGEIFEELRSTMPEQAFTDLFGSVEAMNAALQITGTNSEKVTEQLGNMETASGATEKAFDTMQSTSGKQMADAMNSMKVSFAEIGRVLLPAVAGAMKGMAAAMSGVIKGIAFLIKWIKKLVNSRLFEPIKFIAKTYFSIWVEIFKKIGLGIPKLIGLFRTLVGIIKNFAQTLTGPWELLKKGLKLYLDIIEKIENIGNKLTGGIFGKVFSKVVGLHPVTVAARELLGEKQVWDKDGPILSSQDIGPGLAGMGAGAGLSKLNFLKRSTDSVDAGSLIPRIEPRFKTTGVSAGMSGMNDALGLNLLAKANEEQKKAKAAEIQAMKEGTDGIITEIEDSARIQAAEAARQLSVSKIQISLMGKNLDEIVNSGQLVGMTQSEINKLFQASQMNAMANDQALSGIRTFRSDASLAKSFGGDPAMLKIQKEIRDKLKTAYLGESQGLKWNMQTSQYEPLSGMVNVTGGNLGLGGQGIAEIIKRGGVARLGVNEIAPGVYYNVTVEGNIYASDDSGRAIVEAIDAYAVSQGQTAAESLGAQNATL